MVQLDHLWEPVGRRGQVHILIGWRLKYCHWFLRRQLQGRGSRCWSWPLNTGGTWFTSQLHWPTQNLRLSCGFLSLTEGLGGSRHLSLVETPGGETEGIVEAREGLGAVGTEHSFWNSASTTHQAPFHFQLLSGAHPPSFKGDLESETGEHQGPPSSRGDHNNA